MLSHVSQTFSNVILRTAVKQQLTRFQLTVASRSPSVIAQLLVCVNLILYWCRTATPSPCGVRVDEEWMRSSQCVIVPHYGQCFELLLIPNEWRTQNDEQQANLGSASKWPLKSRC